MLCCGPVVSKVHRIPEEGRCSVDNAPIVQGVHRQPYPLTIRRTLWLFATQYKNSYIVTFLQSLKRSKGLPTSLFAFATAPSMICRGSREVSIRRTCPNERNRRMAVRLGTCAIFRTHF